MEGIVKKGDFIDVVFEASTAGGPAFEKTTRPLLVVAGAGQVLAGLDEMLVGSKLGQERKEKIPKEKAFGERRPELLKLIPLQEFQKRGLEPTVGQSLDVDGMPARVQSVSGGRVRLDFNHELAGMDLEYSFKVEKIYVTAQEKLNALKNNLLDRIGAPSGSSAEKLAQTAAELKVVLKDGLVSVAVPSMLDKTQAYLVAKGHFIAQALLHIGEVKKVVFTEEYDKPELTE